MGWFRKINKNGEDYKPIGNVITATSLSVSGPDLADGDVVRVMFTTDIAGSDTSTPLALTWNGGVTPIPVKASKEGSLASVYAHEVATNIFKYISGYITLEMVFDGTNLVIIGNPVVLSGSDYTIYADGYDEKAYIKNQNKLSDYETATLPMIVPYDGELVTAASNGGYVTFSINGTQYTVGSSAGMTSTSGMIIKKGDNLQLQALIGTVGFTARYYKLRDYSNR